MVRKMMLLIATGIVLNIPESSGQSVKRQCISGYGAGGFADGIIFNQTVGQCFSTSSQNETNQCIQQGFQQYPLSYSNDVLFNSKRDVDLTVFPNPAGDYFTIFTRQSIKNAYLVVYDLSGSTVYIEHIPLLETTNVNCSFLQNGVYVVAVSDESNRISTLKLIIKK